MLGVLAEALQGKLEVSIIHRFCQTAQHRSIFWGETSHLSMLLGLKRWFCVDRNLDLNMLEANLLIEQVLQQVLAEVAQSARPDG